MIDMLNCIVGTKDEVVNWLHGNGLWKVARESYEPFLALMWTCLIYALEP